MKKSFREYHLFKILNSFEFDNFPLDVHLSKYFRKNRAIGSKDRKYIAEKIYTLIRWMGLVDHHCTHSHEWEERCRALNALSIKKSLKDTSIPLHIRASFPKDLFSLLQEHYGEEKAFSLCLASNTPAPTTIRANVLKTTRQALFAKWKEKFSILLTKESVFGVQFEKKINFGALDEFKNGLFEVQDEASQLVANLVEAKPGDQILDYCAGSGGKTLAFAHKLQGKGQIYLHDIRPRPLIEAKRRLKRAGVENAQILMADAPSKKNLLGKMDWIFVDVPCSGSGTLRRNPDLKWKFSTEMLHRLIEEQKKIVKEALAYLSPKGKIIYATCSILPQENEQQIDFFQQEYGLNLTLKPFRSFPTEGGMDGFFGATLKRLEN
ncbi:MAG: Ribosomal RNA small subunit methyltransferase B [Chlamydiae bacterium]|nr:Ribosomal RNA small subunit methyltransferase B [Chlamydiota bacterium]